MIAGRAMPALATALALAGGCAPVAIAPVAGLGAVPVAVRNAGFEDDPVPGRACPPSWWCTMHADPSSFSFEVTSDAGSHGRYLAVRRVKDEPWAFVTQAFPAADMAGKRFQLSVAVNTERLEGPDASAGPVIVLQDISGRTVGQIDALAKRGSGWQRASAELVVPAGIAMVEIGLLVHGGGAAGFDDVEAQVTAPGRHEQ